MTDTAPNTAAPLIEWNRLNVENAEQALESALYVSASESGAELDKFSMWLLAGTGASGALCISQIGSVLPYLTAQGFKVCMAFLLTSALCGFAAKLRSLRRQIQVQMQKSIAESMGPVFSHHESQEEEIEAMAEEQGIVLETDINFTRVIENFLESLPVWTRYLVSRKTQGMVGDRQAGPRMAFKAYLGQVWWTSLQGVAFLAFLVAGAVYAAAI